MPSGDVAEGPTFQSFERTRPAKGQLGLQDCCIGSAVSALMNGGQTVVNPDPIADLPSRAFVHQVVESGI